MMLRRLVPPEAHQPAGPALCHSRPPSGHVACLDERCYAPATVLPRPATKPRHPVGYAERARRGVRAAEGARLEIAYVLKGASRVQIPLPPFSVRARLRGLSRRKGSGTMRPCPG